MTLNTATQRILDYLADQGGSGAAAQEISFRLGYACAGNVSSALNKLHAAGLVGFVLEPTDEGGKRKRWYVAGRVPQQRPIDQFPSRTKLQIAARTAATPNGVKGWVDKRYAIDSVPSVVDSGQCRPWAAVAAGSYGA